MDADSCVTNLRMCLQGCFDFTTLNPYTAKLNLIVASPQVFDRPVMQYSPKIPGGKDKWRFVGRIRIRNVSNSP